MELIKSVIDRLDAEIKEARLIAEDLNVHLIDQVTLTRLEAHAVKLEVYRDLLGDVIE